MTSDPKEQVVKDLLYEASARKYLKEGRAQKKRPIFKYLAAAAAAVALIFILVNFPSGDTIDKRTAMVQEEFTFPTITKSRSSSIAIVDNYIKELNAEQYELVLEKLYGNTLSEKDAYTKSQLYFKLGRYTEAEALLEDYVFKDAYYNEEKRWLQFLLAFQKGNKKEQLIELKNTLSLNYQTKAKKLLDRQFQ